MNIIIGIGIGIVVLVVLYHIVMGIAIARNIGNGRW